MLRFLQSYGCILTSTPTISLSFGNMKTEAQVLAHMVERARRVVRG